MGKAYAINACPSPVPELIPGTIVLHKHTRHGHIEFFHPEVPFGSVQVAMSNPCYICESKTEPGDWVFVSERCTNEYGDVLRVSVRNVDGVNLVTSAYYSGATNHGVIRWGRDDG